MATLILPVLVLAVPILDTSLVTVARLARRQADPSGRPRPLLAPARPLRALRAACSGAARRDRVLHRRLEPRLQRARELPVHDRRSRRDVRAARPVRELPRRRRPPPATRRVGRVHAGLRRALAAARRGARRRRRDHRVVPRGLRDRVRLARNRQPALRTGSDPARDPGGALPRLHPVRALPLGLALRRGPRRDRRGAPPSSSRSSSRSPSWCSPRTCATSAARSS